MSLIALNTVPPVTSPLLFSATVPVPSFVAQSLTVILSAFIFAFPFTVPCNVVNVVFVAKLIFDPSICVVPLVILVTFVSNSVNAVAFA